MSRTDPEHEGGTVTERRTRTRRPRPYHVVFHNDDYTTMEFVIKVLEKLFHHTPSRATQLMLEVHSKGRAVVGTYTRDLAETKANETIRMAREEGHPLQCTVEPG